MRDGPLSGSSPSPESGLGALARALRARRNAGGGETGIVLSLEGGAGGLISRSASRRLITTVTSQDVDRRSAGIVGWLERSQARRSRFLVVPDRASGVAIALRWRISPERFRLAASFERETRETALSAAARRRPWHSGG